MTESVWLDDLAKKKYRGMFTESFILQITVPTIKHIKLVRRVHQTFTLLIRQEFDVLPYTTVMEITQAAVHFFQPNLITISRRDFTTKSINYESNGFTELATAMRSGENIAKFFCELYT